MSFKETSTPLDPSTCDFNYTRFFGFDIFLMIKVTSATDTSDIIIAVRKIKLYDSNEGNKPTIPFKVV